MSATVVEGPRPRDFQRIDGASKRAQLSMSNPCTWRERSPKKDSATFVRPSRNAQPPVPVSSAARRAVQEHPHPASGIGPIARGSAHRAPTRLLAVDLDG